MPLKAAKHPRQPATSPTSPRRFVRPTRASYPRSSTSGPRRRRSGCDWIRELEHLTRILFNPDNANWQYQSAKDADIVFTFRLRFDQSLERHTLRAWRQRAIIEGILPIYFNTYTRSEAFNRVVASFGLTIKNIRGAIANHCVDAPEVRCVRLYKDIHHLQSTAIFSLNSRLKRYLRSAFLAAASNAGGRYALAVFLIRAAEDLLRQLHSSLLQAGKLRWTCNEANGFRSPFGLRASKMSREKIRQKAPEGKLLLGLKYGSSSSLLVRTEPDDAAHGKIAMTARSADDEGAEELDLEWDEGPYANSVRRAFS